MNITTPGTPRTHNRMIVAHQFWGLFTFEERIAARELALTDPVVEDLLYTLNMAGGYVFDVANSTTIDEALTYLMLVLKDSNDVLMIDQARCDTIKLGKPL